MLKASTPPRFNIAFASGAGAGFIRPIPQISQIGIQNGAASLTDGFPPLNFQPVAAGGVPPFGEDFNGILNQITLWNQWFEAGAPIFYDATFATGASGGYPKGAIVQSNVVPGDFWMSTADNNTTDPDSISAVNWVPDPSRIAPGMPVPSFSSTVPTGYVPCNTLTIGNASSNATGRANGDTLLAYRAVWQQFSNTACPIFTSAGAPSTRGANPDADFAANKALATPDLRGQGLVGVDTMGGPASTRLAGVPVVIGSTTAPGSIVGENLHTLVASQIPTITSSVSVNVSVNVSGSISGTTSSVGVPLGGAFLISNEGAFPESPMAPSSASVSGSFSGSGSGSGSGSATSNNTGSGSHNTVGLSTTVFWNLKL